MTSILKKFFLLGLKFCPLVLIACLAGLHGAVAAAEQPPTLEEIIAGLELREKLFFDSDSMFVRYERTQSEDLMPTVASGGLLPAQWTLSYKDGKWFNKRRFTDPKKIKDLTIPAEPKTCIAKDQHVLQWDAVFNQAFIDQASKGLNIYVGMYFTRNLSLDSPKHMAEAGGVEKDLKNIRKQYADDAGLPFLPEFLRENKAHYRVLAEPEQIDGRQCWIVQWPGMDRFCVDVDRGFAIPHRKYCWGPGEPARYEFRNSDYREVKPGLWLPFTQVVDRYASIVAEKRPLWGKVACRTQYKVNEMHFDDVPDSLFDLELPQGASVFDAVRNFSYIVSGPDNADPFSASVAQGKEILNRSAMRTPLIVGNVLILLGIVCFAWRRRKQTQSTAGVRA